MGPIRGFRPGNKRLFPALLYFLALVLLAGCKKEQTTVAGEGDYRVYYENLSGTGIGYRIYHTEETETEKLVNELWNELCREPTGSGQASAVQNGVVLLKSTYFMNNLNLYFNSVAATMDTVSQVMFRAAIVRTFTGI